MYKRVEKKEEGSLTWDGQNTSRLKSNNKEGKETFLDTFFNPQATIKETIIHLAKMHTKLFALLMIFVFPYTLGVILFYSLFYIYTGMGLQNFLILQEQYNQFEPWVIGFYLLMLISFMGFGLYTIYISVQNKGVKYSKAY